MARQLLTIAKNTFTESIRQPIFLVLLLVGCGTIAVSPSFTAYSMEHGGDNKMLIDLGLGAILLFHAFLIPLTITTVLNNELESKTVLTVVSKPVAKPIFIIGKFLGIALAIALSFLIMSVTLMLAVRHGVMQTARHEFDGPVLLFGLGGALIAVIVAAWGNYFYRKVFNSTLVVSLLVAGIIALGLVMVISKQWTLQSPLAEFPESASRFGQLGLGLVMLFQAIVVLTAVAVACATRLKPVMTLLVCLGIYALGLVSNSLDGMVNDIVELPRQMSTAESFAPLFAQDLHWGMKALFGLVKIVHLIAPNLQFLWPGESLTQGINIEATHLGTLAAYSGLYVVAAIAFAVILFQRREVG